MVPDRLGAETKSGANMAVVPEHLGSKVTGSEMTGADLTRVRFCLGAEVVVVPKCLIL